MLVLHFSLWAILISVTDIKFHKVHRLHVYLATLSLLPWMSIQATKVALFNLTIYLLLFLLSKGQIGFGDVRLSLLIGAYLGLQQMGYSEVLTVNLISWSCASLYILERWLFKGSNYAVPFAPFMFLSVFAAALINTAELI